MSLRIHLGLLEDAIKNPGKSFNHMYENQWFEDTFVKDMIKSIDNCTHINGNLFNHDVLGLVPCENLSTGVKNLILGYKLDRIIDASYCGDNCVKWLLKIGDIKDLTICLSHTLTVPTNFKAFMLNTNEYVYSDRDYYDYNFYNLRCYHLKKEYTTLVEIKRRCYPSNTNINSEDETDMFS